jgi:hypothetical protein
LLVVVVMLGGRFDQDLPLRCSADASFDEIRRWCYHHR